MMKKLLILLVVSCLGPTGDAGAQSSAGAVVLTIPPDARAEGMGRAFAFLDRSPFGAWGNVGALGGARGVQAAFGHTQLVPDLGDVPYAYGSVLVRLGQDDGAEGHGPTLDLNYTDLSYDEWSQFYGSYEAFERTVGVAAGLALGSTWSVGAGLKFLRIKIAPDAKADHLAFDLGGLGVFPLTVAARDPASAGGALALNAVAGLAVHNLGTNIKFFEGNAGDPLPRVLRLAGGVEGSAGEVSPAVGRLLGDVSFLSFRIAGGVQKWLVEHIAPGDGRDEGFLERNEIELYGGGEVAFLDLLSFRAGYLYDEQGEVKDPTWGVGIALLGFAHLDYASIPQFRDLERVEKTSLRVTLPI